MPSEKLVTPTQIMVCVDGSETGYRAADFALGLASKLQCKVYFVNVVGASTSERNYSITADMVGSFERLGIEALTKCKDKAEKHGLQFETVQLSGDPADEILRYAEKTKCDCIVMGRKGMGRLEKMLLGSVSEKVLNVSNAPVVIVK
jgi:nucleotide-binding universal stress UspA family protein